VLFHQPAHVRAEHAHDAGGLDRFDGGRAALVLEHGQLAEDVSRPECRERDRATVAVGAHGPGVPLSHDIARVAGIALAEDDLAWLEVPWERHLGDPLEVGGLERGERWHPSEQLDHVC
jgi:hypothetical protein